MAYTVDVYIMGKRYDVPEGITILTAFEHAGYHVVRGCGCRGGFCGACATVFRTPPYYNLKVGLACQTTVEVGMILAMIPFFPAPKAIYDMSAMQDPAKELAATYPELYTCLGCSSCTKACPQDIDVMSYVQAAARGDLKRAAEISFDCIMCGLCASRCTAQMAPYQIAMYVRRAFALTGLQKPDFLPNRIEEVVSGQFDQEINRLKNMNIEELKKEYDARNIEKL